MGGGAMIIGIGLLGLDRESGMGFQRSCGIKQKCGKVWHSTLHAFPYNVHT